MRNELINQIDELQNWFAARSYGWREQATAGQLQQWADRERELDCLIERLEIADRVTPGRHRGVRTC